MEILWKGTVSALFQAIRPKLCGNCPFPQNFHIRKLGEITVFYAVLNWWQDLYGLLRFPSQHILTIPNTVPNRFTMFPWVRILLQEAHCVKSARIRSCSGPYFPLFGLNKERYGVVAELGILYHWGLSSL